MLGKQYMLNTGVRGRSNVVTGAREEDVEVPKHSDLSDQAGLPHLTLNQTLLPHHCFFCGFSLMDLGEFALWWEKKKNSHLRLKNTKEREFNKVVMLVSRPTV